MSVSYSGEGVTISDYETVRQALFSRDLAQYTPNEMVKGNILEDVVMLLHGEAHRQRRKSENPLFRREAVAEKLRNNFSKIVEGLLDRLLASGERNVIKIGQILTLALSADLTGIDVEPNNLKQLRRLSELEHLIVLGTDVMDSTYDLDELLTIVADALAAFDQEFYAASRAVREQRVDRSDPDAIGDDLLETLLLQQDELGMDDALMLRETAFFLESGSDTSSRTLADCLEFLLTWRDEDPARWRRLSAGEARTALLDRCVQETLRLRPIVPVTRRIAVADVTVGDVSIEDGERVFLDIVAANRDPAVFGDHVDMFDPFREIAPGVPRYGHSFSGGMHSCIGRIVAIGAPAAKGDVAPIRGQVPQMVDALLRRGITWDGDRRPSRDPSSHMDRIGDFIVAFQPTDVSAW